MVRLSDGGWLVLGEYGAIHRLDRRGRVVETREPGQTGYAVLGGDHRQVGSR